ASYKLRKAQKLIKEAEAKGAVVKHDTVYKDKLVPIKGKSTVINTPLIIHHYHDTTYYKDKILIKNIYHHDTLTQYIKCPDSTAHVKEAAAINTTINCPPEDHIWRKIALILMLILGGTIGALVIRK